MVADVLCSHLIEFFILDKAENDDGDGHGTEQTEDDEEDEGDAVDGGVVELVEANVFSLCD